MNTKRLIFAALASALLCSPALLNARQPQDSVAEAARKAQAEKKASPKPKIVFDNDNLDSVKGTINVVGQEPAPPADQAKPAAEDKTKPEAEKPPVKDEAYWRKQFAEANKKLADDSHELDILQREYNLKEQQYYSDPNTAMREQFDRKDLTDTKQGIEDKSAAVAKDKQDISDLEDALRQAGGDPGWARQP
jgi:chromosome segregation ATPase